MESQKKLGSLTRSCYVGSQLSVAHEPGLWWSYWQGGEKVSRVCRFHTQYPHQQQTRSHNGCCLMYTQRIFSFVMNSLPAPLVDVYGYMVGDTCKCSSDEAWLFGSEQKQQHNEGIFSESVCALNRKRLCIVQVKHMHPLNQTEFQDMFSRRQTTHQVPTGCARHKQLMSLPTDIDISTETFWVVWRTRMFDDPPDCQACVGSNVLLSKPACMRVALSATACIHSALALLLIKETVFFLSEYRQASMRQEHAG